MICATVETAIKEIKEINNSYIHVCEDCLMLKFGKYRKATRKLMYQDSLGSLISRKELENLKLELKRFFNK